MFRLLENTLFKLYTTDDKKKLYILLGKYYAIILFISSQIMFRLLEIHYLLFSSLVGFV